MPRSDGIIPIGADNPQVLHALKRKHAELSGKIGVARQALRTLTTELGHIDAAMRIFDPTINTGKIRAKSLSRRDPTGAGAITGVVLDVIREAPGPLTPREITYHLMELRGLAADDRDLFEILVKRVRACLRAQRIRGLIQSLDMTGFTKGWVIVDDDD